MSQEQAATSGSGSAATSSSARRRGAREQRLGELDALGVPHLIVHELAYSKDNREAMIRRGYKAKSPRYSVKGMRPISGSALAALRLLLHALKTTRRLSVYYCSHDTIEMINLRGARYRRAALDAGVGA